MRFLALAGFLALAFASPASAQCDLNPFAADCLTELRKPLDPSPMVSNSISLPGRPLADPRDLITFSPGESVTLSSAAAACEGGKILVTLPASGRPACASEITEPVYR